MDARSSRRLRLLLIGSSVLAALATVVIGIPRGRALMTPRIESVRVVSAALGDAVASSVPREVLEGTPVTLYAIVSARRRFAAEAELFGSVDRVLLDGDSEPRTVGRWQEWWLAPEFLWFKVEPAYPFANETLDPGFAAEKIPFVDRYQVSWGFDWSHAADISPGGDEFPELPVGTMRFGARVVVRDAAERILQQVSGPAAVQVHTAGGAAPHRVTIRAGDDAFGRMQGFAGLPYVPMPSSTTAAAHPTARYLGGTVLSFWLASARAAADYDGEIIGWERLPELAERVVDDMFLARDGTYYWTDDPRRAVDYSVVRTGDLVTIDDHVGVLYEDRGPGGAGDGILNRYDRVLEAYFEPLRDSAMGDAFQADITVWRLRAGADDG